MKQFALILAFAAAFAGAPSVARAADTVEVRVSAHACGPEIPSISAFAKLRQIADKLGACDVMSGTDSPVMLRVRGAQGIVDMRPTEFVPAELCRWELEGGEDKGSSRECFDASYHLFKDVPKGQISVMSAPGKSMRFGAVAFNPDFLNGNDVDSLVSYATGVASLNATKDMDGIITLHVFTLPEPSSMVPGAGVSVISAEAVSEAGLDFDADETEFGNTPSVSDALSALKSLLRDIGGAISMRT